MSHLIGISGSLRHGSHNTALLRAAFEGLPEGVTSEIASLDGIPMFNRDEERSDGMPPAVAELRAKVAAADGIVFATPEYNFSVTGAMKNAIDWLSRGPSSPLDFKPAAIVGAGGGGGTRRAQQHLRDMLTHNSLRVLADPQVMVPGARMRFEGGDLTDDSVRAELSTMIDAFLELIAREKATLRPEVRGSILIAAPGAAAADELARRVAERGYRTLSTIAASDAQQLIRSRAIAAAILDPTYGDRFGVVAALSEHHPQAPVILADDPRTVGGQLDDALRLELADR
jgi:chromate reductase